jgi:hypothetical protein
MCHPKLHRSDDGSVTPEEVLYVYNEWDDIQNFDMKPQILMGFQERIAYVMIPKNAHHSATWFMKPYVEVDKPPDGCTVFTIIRNPLTRFISAYLLVNNALGYPAPGIGELVRSFPYWKIDDPIKRFAQYIKDVSYYGLYDEHLMTQNYYLDVDIKIDEYLVFEHIQEQMNDFRSRHNLNVEFPKITFRKFPELAKELAKELLTFVVSNREYFDMLLDLYSDDFELYYEKGGSSV